MLRTSLFIVLGVLSLAFTAMAQTDNCVKGDYFTDYRQPSDKLKNEFKAIEDKLCAEIKENSNLEAIYGFVRGTKYGEILRVYKDRAVFTDYEDLARYKEREVSGEELKNFQKEIAAAKIETLKPLSEKTCVDMCRNFEFLAITRQGGRRVHIFGSEYPPPMGAIKYLFEELEKSGNFRVHYYLQDQIKETKLLFADNRFWAEAVWKKRDDLRVLVSDRTIEDWQKRFSWRKFSNAKLGEIAAQPEDSQYLNADGLWRFCNDYPFKTGLGEYSLCTDNYGKGGLWKERKGERVKIQDGIINYPFVTPDKKWIIYGKALVFCHSNIDG